MKRWFVIVRPWMIQWSHSELVEWAQIASNYEETTYHAAEICSTTRRRKKSSPQELVKKWQNGRQNKQKDATHGHCKNRTKVWKNPRLHNTDATLGACPGGNFRRDALDCACTLEIPVFGYKSSQRSHSDLTPNEDFATDTQILSLSDPIALPSQLRFNLWFSPYRTLSQ